ncbi:MAG TPA: hypothetical protein VFY20_08190 [Gemmatimonadales bacterium]|nr:hypothetical protein [Gemmatimonadales bacterium]
MRRFLVLAIALVWPTALAAQASIFGIRGPGFPGRPLSARAVATGGSFGLFDGESSLGPSSLGFVGASTGTFTMLGDYRSVSTPVSDDNLRTVRFPQTMVTAPFLNGRMIVGLSASLYTNRDYAIVTVDTSSIFDNPVIELDSVGSRGSLSDFRFAMAYRGLPQTTVGLGIHFITGVARQTLVRRFISDSSFAAVVQRAEVAGSGIGLSIGGTRAFGQQLWIGGVVRKDFRLSLDSDSIDVGSFALPWTFAGGARYRIAPRFDVATQVMYRTWSSVDSFLVAGGAPGSGNTVDLSVGAELVQSVQRPGNLPVRLGLRYATLPYLTTSGKQPYEYAISGGTGMRFAKDRAGIDVTLDKVWRKDGEGRSENAWLIYVAASLRP